MKAVVFHGVGDIRVDNVPSPKLKAPTDAIVRVTTAAICGTDLHFVRGTVPGMFPGTIIGHEGVGVVEEVGASVTNFKAGDRVLLSAVLGCGSCAYCQPGYFVQCDDINPKKARVPPVLSTEQPQKPDRSTVCRRSMPVFRKRIPT